jgi:hypothetical protein
MPEHTHQVEDVRQNILRAIESLTISLTGTNGIAATGDLEEIYEASETVLGAIRAFQEGIQLLVDKTSNRREARDEKAAPTLRPEALQAST